MAARRLEDAQKFAEKHGIDKAYGDYSCLATDPDIDVVYVGSIHPQHLALVKQFLQAGKHVLCEKPLCMNVRETVELVELARRKKLFLMEAIWSRCIPSYEALRQELAAATIGDVKQVLCTFGAASLTCQILYVLFQELSSRLTGFTRRSSEEEASSTSECTPSNLPSWCMEETSLE